MSTLYVNSAWTDEAAFNADANKPAGAVWGTDAFASFVDALKNVSTDTEKIEIAGDISESAGTDNIKVSLSRDLTISGGNVSWTSGRGWVWFTVAEGVADVPAVKFEGFTLNGANSNTKVFYFGTGTQTIIDSTSSVEFYNGAIQPGAQVTVQAGGKLICLKEALQVQADDASGSRGSLIVEGAEDFDAAQATLEDRQVYTKYVNVYADVDVADSYYSAYDYINVRDSGKFTADNSVVEIGADENGVWQGNPVPNGFGQLKVSSADAVFTLENGSVLKASGNITNSGTINVIDSTLLADGTLVSGGVVAEAYNKGVVTNNGTINVSGESTLNIRELAGNTIDFMDGAVIKDSTVGGGVFVAGNVTFRGDNTFGMITDFGTLTDYYGTTAPMAWTVEAGASVTLSNKARYGLGYGDKVVINGEIAAGGADAARAALEDDDLTNDVKQSLFMHGLVAQESKGWNCDSSFTVNNAFVTIGSNSSFGNKPGNYGGSYTFSFNNSVLDASRITFYEALSTTEFTFKDSNVKTGQFMTRDADSVFTLDNSTVLSTSTSNGNDEGNYNAGTLNVINGSTLTYSFKMHNEATGVINVENAVFTAPEVENKNAFNVSGNSTLNIKSFSGNDITASGVLKDSELTMETFDWETGNVMVDGELEVQNGVFKNVQFRVDEGEKVTVSGNVAAAGATQFKAVNGAVVLAGTFSSDISEASSIELEGSDAELTIEKDGKAKITGGFYLNGGTSTITGSLSEETDFAALTRDDAQVDAAYSTWGGSYAANVTLADTYVWNAMISLNHVDTEVTVDHSLLVGWMSFDITAGTLIAQNGSLVNHQAAEGWAWSTIGADAALIVKDGSTFDAAKTALTNNGSITVDGSSFFSAKSIAGTGSITIDAAGFTGTSKVIDLNGSESLKDKITVENLADNITVIYGKDGDVILSDASVEKLYVGDAYADRELGESVDGKVVGANAFGSVFDAVCAQTEKTTEIKIESDITEALSDARPYSGNLVADKAVKITDTANIGVEFIDLTIGKNITVETKAIYWQGENTIDGKVIAASTFYNYNSKKTVINGSAEVGNTFNRYQNAVEDGIYVVGTAAAGEGKMPLCSIKARDISDFIPVRSASKTAQLNSVICCLMEILTMILTARQNWFWIMPWSKRPLVPTLSPVRF